MSMEVKRSMTDWAIDSTFEKNEIETRVTGLNDCTIV